MKPCIVERVSPRGDYGQGTTIWQRTFSHVPWMKPETWYGWEYDQGMTPAEPTVYPYLRLADCRCSARCAAATNYRPRS